MNPLSMKALGLAAAALALVACPAWGQSYAERAEVQEFIRAVAARHGFSEQDLRYVFSRVRRADPVLEAIKPPPKARSWEEYRGTFVNEKRIAAGVAGSPAA